MSEQVDRSWDRIEAWLAANAPEAFASLRPPADPATISGAADRLGVVLPDDVRASLLRHDGVAEVHGKFTLAGNRLMPVERLIERSLGMVQSMEGVIEHEGDDEAGEHYLLSGYYWHRQYVLLTDSVTVDGLVVDCRPGDTHGAIGDFFNGEGTGFGDWASFGDLLEQLADALEQGRAFDGEIPVAFGGRLAWEREPEPLSGPTSLLSAAAGVAPAPPRRLSHRFTPIPEAGWVGEQPHFCLAFTENVDEDEVLRRYGALPESFAPRTREEARDASGRWTDGYLPVVRAGRVGGWTFGFEESARSQGAREEVLRRLSAGTRTVVVRHSGHSQLALYEDGVLVSDYDTLRPDERRGTRPDRFAEALHRARLLPLDTTRYRDEDAVALLRVVSDEFGIAVDSGVLRAPLRSARILPLLDDVRSRPPQAVPVSAEPVVAGLVAYAPPERLHAALAAQASRLAEEVGLDAYAEVTQALRRAQAGDIWRVGDDSALGVRLRTVAADMSAARESSSDDHARHLISDPERGAWSVRFHAAQALLHLWQLPPRDAAWGLLHQRRNPNWRAEFAADLGDVPVPPDALERLMAEQAPARGLGRRLSPLQRRPERVRADLHMHGRSARSPLPPGRGRGLTSVIRTDDPADGESDSAPDRP